MLYEYLHDVQLGSEHEHHSACALTDLKELKLVFG
jgi:hypothetical protein